MALRYLALAATLAAPIDPPDIDNQPFWAGHPDGATFERSIEARLERARGLLGRLAAVTGRRTIANTLVPYDNLMRELDRAGSEAGLIQSVHPGLRAARDGGPKPTAGLGLRDRPLARSPCLRCDHRAGRHPGRSRHPALPAADPPRLPAGRRGQGPGDPRPGQGAAGRAGPHRPGFRPERARGRAGDRGGRGGRAGGTTADYIAAHPAGPDGKIHLTMEYPDVFPILTYARSGELRRRVRTEFDNRAYPANMAVLERMIARRDELRASSASRRGPTTRWPTRWWVPPQRLRVHRAGRHGVGSSFEPGLPDAAQAEAAGRARCDGGESVGDVMLS